MFQVSVIVRVFGASYVILSTDQHPQMQLRGESVEEAHGAVLEDLGLSLCLTSFYCKLHTTKPQFGSPYL